MMIELKDLSYGYTRKTVLEGLNVRFEEGGMYAVMGANGCGKTTLLRLVAGLLVPDRGEVLVGVGSRAGAAHGFCAAVSADRF